MEAETKTVAVRYCGGCNPRYDRVAFVKRLEELLPELRFVPAEAGTEYGAALVVCGCGTRCASTGDLSVPAARTVTAGGFDELLAARDRLRSLTGAAEPVALSREEILKILPHRPPMLFLDRVTRLVPGEEIAAEFYADPALGFFQGHFPGAPVFPGALLAEAMAQAAGVMLLSLKKYGGLTPYLLGLGKANFRKPVLPGDTLDVRAALLAEKPELGAAVCKGQIFVNKDLAADAEIILAPR